MSFEPMADRLLNNLPSMVFLLDKLYNLKFMDWPLVGDFKFIHLESQYLKNCQLVCITYERLMEPRVLR
jgi:hypothetical protein